MFAIHPARHDGKGSIDCDVCMPDFKSQNMHALKGPSPCCRAHKYMGKHVDERVVDVVAGSVDVDVHVCSIGIPCWKGLDRVRVSVRQDCTGLGLVFDRVVQGSTGLDRVRVSVGQGWAGLERVGQCWKGFDRVGQGVWLGLVRVGQGWTGLGSVGQGWSILNNMFYITDVASG